MVQITSAIQAIRVIRQIEFTLDGQVQRQPNAGEYMAAVAFLEDLHKFYEIKQTAIMTREVRRFGQVYASQPTGMFAEFGKTEDGRNTLHITGRYGDYMDVDIKFTEGDTAIFDSYNFDYLGTITKITEKGQISVTEDDGQVTRFDASGREMTRSGGRGSPHVRNQF